MKEIFNTLNAINVNEHTEKKNNLTYLSWAWAWAEVKKAYPDATYKIRQFEGRPYIYDDNLGYLVMTEMTINGLTHEMWLPVMDGANKAMKAEPYTYYVKNRNFQYAKKNPDNGLYYDKFGNRQDEYIEKEVDSATMFDINTAIMRCLTKNIAMFGLGLYIYAGEDLPEGEAEKEADEQKQAMQSLENMLVSEIKIKALIARCEKESVDVGKIMKLYKVSSLADLTEKKYAHINLHWEDIKKA
jgi:hypothetical protein